MQGFDEAVLESGAWTGVGSSAPSAHESSETTGCGDTKADGYRSELPTWQLIVEVQRLLAEERRAGRLVCRYLADLADRVRERRDVTLLAYSDEFDVMRCFFGLGVRDARERVRIGRALRELPRLERAFLAGELSYSRVREISRVATEATEPAWLDHAAELDMRALERRVALERDRLLAGSEPREHEERVEEAALPVDSPREERIQEGGLPVDSSPGKHEERMEEGALPVDSQPGARMQFSDDAGSPDEAWAEPDAESLRPGTLRVTFELSVEQWQLLERALEGARRAAGGLVTDGEALEAVARQALSSRGEAHAEPTEKQPLSAAREPQVQPVTTQGGSSDSPSEAASVEADSVLVRAAGALSDPAARLMQIMGRRPGWTTDELMEVSGLSYQEVQCALLMLELGNLVRRRLYTVDPVRVEPRRVESPEVGAARRASMGRRRMRR